MPRADRTALQRGAQAAVQGVRAGTQTVGTGKKRLVCRINPHGTAAKKKITVRKVPRDKLLKGIEVELEHTNSRSQACGIALDHLAESRHYYDLLELVEATLRVIK